MRFKADLGNILRVYGRLPVANVETGLEERKGLVDLISLVENHQSWTSTQLQRENAILKQALAKERNRTQDQQAEINTLLFANTAHVTKNVKLNEELQTRKAQEERSMPTSPRQK